MKSVMPEAINLVAGANAGLPSQRPLLKTGGVLGFDFGRRRTGVAVGDLSLRMAHPLCTINSINDSQRLAQVAALVEQWSPVLFVVGLPVNMDDTEHLLSRPVRRFARAIEHRFKVDTRLVDERLTSAEAQSLLDQSGIRTKSRDGRLDQISAQLILDAFFQGMS
jgi:putative holliday junction resolvase